MRLNQNFESREIGQKKLSLRLSGCPKAPPPDLLAVEAWLKSKKIQPSGDVPAFTKKQLTPSLGPVNGLREVPEPRRFGKQRQDQKGRQKYIGIQYV